MTIWSGISKITADDMVDQFFVGEGPAFRVHGGRVIGEPNDGGTNASPPRLAPLEISWKRANNMKKINT